ncbi:uncharacterized protein FRV6_10489 [Fusarium oxysporum]|uniref:NYN domain-containing protein n=1 Tax=Fusarium oxysporum TaxID=5507 RepID=A0A2H3TCI7_FUSOX|nr:uncharacterized protein FRV6_10489 [Fusarium oxysporum]
MCFYSNLVGPHLQPFLIHHCDSITIILLPFYDINSSSFYQFSALSLRDISDSPGAGRPGPPSDGNARFAHIYMDESNFRISDIRALKGTIRKGIGMKVDEKVTSNVYRSNLEQGLVYQDLKLHSFRVWNFPRKKNRGEKKVDTTLVMDMALDAVHLQAFKETSAFVLVSGDNDMIPAVIYAVQCGYTLHVWVWKDSLSGEYTRLAGKHLIKLTLLDDFLVALTMTNYSVPVGKLPFPPNAVVLLNPWHELPEVLSQLASANMTFMQSLSD